MVLSIAIQHHPARPELPLKLAEAIGLPLALGSYVEVVEDPDPTGVRSPWRTARVAWAGSPHTCTHRLVIQDDAIPCEGFLERVELAIGERPDSPIALFFGRASYPLDTPAYHAALCRGDGWYPIPENAPWIPCVALILPVDQALDLAAFHLPHHDRPSVADDEVVGEWAQARGIRVWATAPSLVDHPDDLPSLMGSAISYRSAMCFHNEYVRPDVIASAP